MAPAHVIEVIGTSTNFSRMYCPYCLLCLYYCPTHQPHFLELVRTLQAWLAWEDAILDTVGWRQVCWREDRTVARMRSLRGEKSEHQGERNGMRQKRYRTGFRKQLHGCRLWRGKRLGV